MTRRQDAADTVPVNLEIHRSQHARRSLPTYWSLNCSYKVEDLWRLLAREVTVRLEGRELCSRTMGCCPHFRRRAKAAIFLTIACGTFGRAQQIVSPDAGNALPGVALPDAISHSAVLPRTAPQVGNTKNTSAPCTEPPPLLKWQDYHGPSKGGGNLRPETGA